MSFESGDDPNPVVKTRPHKSIAMSVKESFNAQSPNWISSKDGSNLPVSPAESNKAYPRHLPPVTALDYESRIQASLKNTKVLNTRTKYTMTVFKVASIILGSVITTVYAANAIIVYDKERQIKELVKKRDDLKNKLY